MFVYRARIVLRDSWVTLLQRTRVYVYIIKSLRLRAWAEHGTRPTIKSRFNREFRFQERFLWS